MNCFRTCVLIVFITCFSDVASADLPDYAQPTIYGRTGVTGFNMPGGSSLASPTISLDDNRDVALDVNYVGNTGNAGVFYAEKVSGSVAGGIVFDASDIILAGPGLNGQQQAIFAEGLDFDSYLYDASTATTIPLNLPLGITAIAAFTHDKEQNVGGRLKFGSGSIYGTFPLQSSGVPSVQIYATDNSIDSSSPFSFLYVPGVSRGTATLPPRIAAKVSTTAGFDFEEIRIFDADGSSTLVAVETETDPASPFSEFVVNTVSISDDGSKVAFQAEDVAGNSGIYLYDDGTGAITLIGSVLNALVDTIDSFAPDVNNQGVVVFRGYDQLDRSSVFVGDGTDVIRIGGEGDTISTDIGTRQLGRRDQDFCQSGAPRINNNGDIGLIFQYHDPDNSGSVADGHLVMLIEPLPVPITPMTVTVTHGLPVQGGVAELAVSDGLDFSAVRNNIDIQSRVFLEVKAISPITTPSSLDFVLEGSVFARTQVVQSIDLWNYFTAQWEEVDSRDARRFVDQTVTVVPTGDVARFVEPGTGCTEARIRFESASQRASFTANVDLIGWTFQF